MIEHTWPIAEKVIGNTLALAAQLHQQLLQEAELLKTSPQAELLDQSTARKKELFAYLEELNGQLLYVLAAEELPNSQEGVNAYFEQAEAAGLNTAEARANWSRIQQICAQCRDLNEQNGASIELLALHAKRSLDILKGRPQAANTYGRNGVTQNETASHTLTFYL